MTKLTGVTADGAGQSFIRGSNGALQTADAFRPSSYETDLTMDGTAQTIALATNVREGGGRVRIVNRGATTEDIRVAFGDSESAAETALTISSSRATTGLWIGSAADGYQAEIILGVPATATRIAIANATAGDTQLVSVTQGV